MKASELKHKWRKDIAKDTIREMSKGCELLTNKKYCKAFPKCVFRMNCKEKK